MVWPIEQGRRVRIGGKSRIIYETSRIEMGFVTDEPISFHSFDPLLWWQSCLSDRKRDSPCTRFGWWQEIEGRIHQYLCSLHWTSKSIATRKIEVPCHWHVWFPLILYPWIFIARVKKHPRFNQLLNMFSFFLLKVQLFPSSWLQQKSTPAQLLIVKSLVNIRQSIHLLFLFTVSDTRNMLQETIWISDSNCSLF